MEQTEEPMLSSKELFKPWSTSSFGEPADLSTGELSGLGDHLGLCRSPHKHMFALHCAAEAMHGFIVSKLVTTVVIVALLYALAAMVL